MAAAQATTLACACEGGKKKEKTEEKTGLVECTHSFAGTDSKEEKTSDKKCPAGCSKLAETAVFAA